MRGLIGLVAAAALVLAGIVWFSLSSQTRSSRPTVEADAIVEEARRDLSAADSLEGRALVDYLRRVSKQVIANRPFTETELKRIKLALIDAEEILRHDGVPVEIRRSVVDEFLQTLESR